MAATNGSGRTRYMDSSQHFLQAGSRSGSSSASRSRALCHGNSVVAARGKSRVGLMARGDSPSVEREIAPTVTGGNPPGRSSRGGATGKMSSARRADADAAGGGYSVYTEISSTERFMDIPTSTIHRDAAVYPDKGETHVTEFTVDDTVLPFSIDTESDDESSVSLVDVRPMNSWEIADAGSVEIHEETGGFDEDFDEECFGSQLRVVEMACCPCLKNKIDRGRRRRRRKSATFLGLGESRLILMAWAFLAAIALAVFAFIDAYDAAESAKHHASGGSEHGGDQDGDGPQDADTDSVFSNLTFGKSTPDLKDMNSSLIFGLEDGLPNGTDIGLNTASAGINASDDDSSTNGPSASHSDSFVSPKLGPPVPPEDMNIICSAQSLANSDGYWKCGAACGKGECCFMPDWHPHYCATGGEKDMCKTYQSACKILERPKEGGD
mmetsp:Transcript_34424/g.103010  ORF Transcript_34424/g.103010 Transcript_34424/m.103010 type:complete len:439 (-) Transcript_34424:8-1324(-)